MPYVTFEQDKAYLLGKFRHPVFDPSTGLDNETIMQQMLPLADTMEGLLRPVIKGRLFAYICRNLQIDVSPHDWFPGFGC